ncbi:hypothetical protein MHYP_G00289490 [Metynnis hypsauchen]
MEGPQNPQKKAKNAGIKKKQQFHSGEIVFTKNGFIQTIPALSKRLKNVTDPIIGLQYVWEYRSPTKSVPPHYQCKLCKVQRLQNEMAAHITGWKHCFRYMNRSHPDKVPHDEEAATKDPAIRKAIKASAAEVENAEGRGQIRIVIKEPGELPAFQNMSSSYLPAHAHDGCLYHTNESAYRTLQPNYFYFFIFYKLIYWFQVLAVIECYSSQFHLCCLCFSESAHPSVGGPGAAGLLGPAPRGLHPGGPFGGGFSDSTFPGEFPPRGGLMSDFPPSMQGGLTDGPIRRGLTDMGRLPSPGRYGNSMPGPDRLMGSPESMQRFPSSGPMRMGSDGFGMGPRNEGMGRPFLSDLPMNSGSDRMMGGGPKSPEPSNTLATLLRYLDTFRIENEDDAQIVLKVTQKLTDVLMEYRLRSISSVPSSAPSSSLGNMNFSSRLPPNSNNRFSGSMTGPSRFYN